MDSTYLEYDHVASGKLSPISDHVIVVDIESEGERVINGIILSDEQGTNRGIRPRWARVHSVGPNQEDINPGDWVFIAHARWTRGIKLNDGVVYRKADIDGLLLVSDEKPKNDYVPG